ncbi:MAG: type III pantothenate kinase [Bellilinea sp.]
MLLTIDIGNTNIALGLYEGTKLGARWRLATDHERMPDEYGIQMLGLLQHSGCAVAQLNGVCMASVVPVLTSRLQQACRMYFNHLPLIVDESISTGIKLLVDDPKTVGADRIVDAVAVNVLYSGPACVVDFGTATTFDAITADGEYLGGAIAPGIGISADALSTRTAKLPRVDLQVPPSVIGRNTIHAMQSGLMLGYISMVEGMVKRFRKELGPEMKVIATGGLAETVAEHTEVIDVLAPWLTLDGLRIIWEMNQG